MTPESWGLGADVTSGDSARDLGADMRRDAREASGEDARGHSEKYRRAYGALAGLAIGDGLGMPTQLLSRDVATAPFPDLRDVEAGPPENAISRGQAAGSATDDTQQALIIAHLLITGDRHVSADAVVKALLAWAREAGANGSEQPGPPSAARSKRSCGACPSRKPGAVAIRMVWRCASRRSCRSCRSRWP